MSYRWLTCCTLKNGYKIKYIKIKCSGKTANGHHPPRSSTDRTLTVLELPHFLDFHTSLKLFTHSRFGDRSFADAGPHLWNSLPISLRQISSYGQFGRYLKNHLFGIWEITVQCDTWFSVLYKYPYLLTYNDMFKTSLKMIVKICLYCWQIYLRDVYLSRYRVENLQIT